MVWSRLFYRLDAIPDAEPILSMHRRVMAISIHLYI